MKKINIKNSRKLNLVADLHTTDSDKLIIMSHGFTGDRHEWGRFDQIAEGFKKMDYNVLVFDFSGSGESDDDSLTVAKQIDDLKSVIKYARDEGYKKIVLFGLSLGGLVSFSCYDEDIKAIVTMAPVTNKVPTEYRHQRYNEEQIKEFNETGQLVYKRDEGFRKEIVIDRQMLLDREEVNPKLLLRNIKCPVLIFHGDEDDAVPLKDSENAIKVIGNKVELYVIEEEGHSFENSINEVINKTINWLSKKV